MLFIDSKVIRPERVVVNSEKRTPAGPGTGAKLSFWEGGGKHDRNPVETAAAVVLLGRGTLVIMEACALSSRQQAASTACDVLPLPGIVG